MGPRPLRTAAPGYEETIWLHDVEHANAPQVNGPVESAWLEYHTPWEGSIGFQVCQVLLTMLAAFGMNTNDVKPVGGVASTSMLNVG